MPTDNMYRNSMNIEKEYPSYTYGGGDGINLKNMYYEASTNLSPSISPTSSIECSSPDREKSENNTLTTSSEQRFGDMDFSNTTTTTSYSIEKVDGSGGGATTNYHENLYKNGQQQQQQQQQQKQQQLTETQQKQWQYSYQRQQHQQLSNVSILKQQTQKLSSSSVSAVAAKAAAASTAVTQEDEISKSLKMFAMLTAFRGGHTNEFIHPQSYIEDATYDFAYNGFVSDELSRSYQQYQAAIYLAHQNFYNSALYNQHQLHQQQQQNLLQQQGINLNDLQSNFWMTLPTRVQQAQAAQTAAAVAAAAAAAFVNIDYNSSSNSNSSTNNNSNINTNNNSNGNFRKPQRRYYQKNDKHQTAKHCVFCENNNEPEAVVKSHAVRDSFGRVLCPKLRTYICPICKASGDSAHTVKYCPQKPIITMEDALKTDSYQQRIPKNSSSYKQPSKV